MNKSPLNYLITAAFGIILWVITAVFFGSAFSESLMLAESTPEDFAGNLRLMLGIAAIIGLFNCFYWYYYGGKDSTAGDLVKAKRIWLFSFIFQLVASIGAFFGLVILNLSDGILVTDWLILYLLISLNTWVFFWICTFFMSPDNVKNVVLGK
jgi:hypothetical protein